MCGVRRDRIEAVLSYGMPKNATCSPRTARPISICALGVLLFGTSAFAQQRPLITEDPEVIGAGRILIEGGIDGAHDMHYPLSGLEGNLWRVPALGVSFGISSIAELQFDGGPYNHLSITKRSPAPLSNLVTSPHAPSCIGIEQPPLPLHSFEPAVSPQPPRPLHSFCVAHE